MLRYFVPPLSSFFIFQPRSFFSRPPTRHQQVLSLLLFPDSHISVKLSNFFSQSSKALIKRSHSSLLFSIDSSSSSVLYFWKLIKWNPVSAVFLSASLATEAYFASSKASRISVPVVQREDWKAIRVRPSPKNSHDLNSVEPAAKVSEEWASFKWVGMVHIGSNRLCPGETSLEKIERRAMRDSSQLQSTVWPRLDAVQNLVPPRS